MENNSQSSRPLVGISACLHGQAVRFNGEHKRDAFIVDSLGQYFDFKSWCPEVGIGLGVPRPTLRLVGKPNAFRVVGVKDASIDVTDDLRRWSRNAADSMSGLCGYIFKKDSPSCGMERVKVYPHKTGAASKKAVGVFADEVMKRYPTLPTEEEGRLKDPILRENFVNRVYVRHRWQSLVVDGMSPSALIEFHTRHKYLVMSHSVSGYKRLGQMLSNLKAGDLDSIAGDYFSELMQVLKQRATRKSHVNTLQHLVGYLKKRIGSDDKREILDSIARYRRFEIPLIVPMTLLHHYFRVNPDEYIARQIYLQPSPSRLGLRNAI
ncbi:MAG: DUF523 and DUF1722 domain-containing protein [Pseudomonadota bacterium]